MEATLYKQGQAVLKRAMQAQFEEIEADLVEAYRQDFPPEEVVGDGHSAVKVISRFGHLELKRQILSHRQEQETKHTMPGNQALPAHNGLIVTRGLQELTCLFSLELPFATVERLLAWHIQEERLLSSTTNRTLIKAHGQIIREAEAAEVEALLAQDEWSGVRPQLVTSPEPRRQASWPGEMQETIAQALAVGQVTAPQGVSLEDWERVIENRRTELPDLEDLRRLGPHLRADQELACLDEVGCVKSSV